MESNVYRSLARTMIEEARAAGYLNGPLSVIRELVDSEEKLFRLLFESMARQLEQEHRTEFSEAEVLSLFTYVYAKAAEAVASHCTHTPVTFDASGMFDGKVPLYAGDGLVGHFKSLNFPGDMTDAFQRWHAAAEANGETAGADPLLLLFEALKWTWRISIHLAVEFLEAHGHKFQEQEMK